MKTTQKIATFAGSTLLLISLSVSAGDMKPDKMIDDKMMTTDMSEKMPMAEKMSPEEMEKKMMVEEKMADDTMKKKM